MEATHPIVLADAPPSDHERHWAFVAHLSAVLLALATSWFAGFAGVLAALAIWLFKRGESDFVAGHALEALNFNLSMLVYAALALLVGVLLAGFSVLTLGLGLLLAVPAGVVLVLALGAIAVLWLVCSLVAMCKALDGQAYRYPFTLRLLD